ncbi:MAG: hypothetical protein VR65_06715 [Desulfobulbaceae bacterium BRH_c16a]|nr:MAG: hypothetical protein VR65_06715 [Desulfobulbaceae bacterium BRH_c16a]
MIVAKPFGIPIETFLLAGIIHSNKEGRDLKTKIISFVVMAFLVVSGGIANSATTLMEIGRSPFCVPLENSDQLIAMVKSRAGEVEKGFELAGRSELYQPFMTQIETTQIQRNEYPKGTRFEWMFFKKKGKGQVRIARDVTWGNEDTFPGYQFDIEHEGTRSTFVVPLGCGNIALLGESRVEEPAPAPVARINQAPTCGMAVSPTKAFCGDTITVDARNSSDPDGTIANMKIAVVDKTGKVVSEKSVAGDALVSEVAMPCGTNTVQVTVTDNEGVDATSAQCTAEVTGIKRVRLVGDVGYYHQFDPGHYVFGRIGGEYRFTEEWSVLGLVGGAIHYDGLDGDDAFLVDVLGEYKFSRYFVNLGVGGWITDGDNDLDAEDDDFDMIAAVGARVFGEPEGFNASVFLEVRSAFDEMDQIDEFGRFGAGVRFRF